MRRKTKTNTVFKTKFKKLLATLPAKMRRTLLAGRWAWLIAVAMLITSSAFAQQNFTTLLPKNGDDNVTTQKKMLTASNNPYNAVVPAQSDTVDLTNSSRAVWVGGVGNVKVNMVGGGTVTFIGVPTGTLLPVMVTRIWSTGTTATNLVELF
jgi:hypothetical protein